MKHTSKGYNSADFCCETFSAIASDKVMEGYETSGFLITFYTPFNLVTHRCYSMLEIEIGKIITFLCIVSHETCL